jgi:hypothetical protein
MAEMTEKEQALAHMRERYPDDPQWQNFDVNAKKSEIPPPPPAEKGGVGPKVGSLELGLAGMGGAYLGNKASKLFDPYAPPEPPPNQAKLALEELMKHREGFSGAKTDFQLKADALKRQSDDLKQLQLLEEEALARARGEYIGAKGNIGSTSDELAARAIITPDAHTRQMQGTGSVVPDDAVTGRARLTGWRATESEIKEAKEAAAANLARLQSSGLVKPGGISLEFPGITAASPYGVLAPATLQADFDQQVAKIAASNMPQEQKLAELKDLYQAQKSRASGAATGALSAEKELLKHLNLEQATLDPFQRAVAAGEARLAGLGGEKAAGALPKVSLGSKMVAKIPGALTGAGAGLSGAEAYERSQQGDSFGAGIAGAGAALEALGTIPHPVAKGVALAGGLSSAGLLALYDAYGPEVLKYLSEKGLYNPSVMQK